MENTKICFIGDKGTNTLHDGLCIMVDSIPEGDKVLLDKIDENMTLCERCRRKIFIRSAIQGDSDNFLWYLDFFDKALLRTEEIRGFIYLCGVRLKKLSDTELQVKYKEDTWIIVYVKRNRYNLLHNNYLVVSETERRICPGFHSQKEVPLRMRDLLKYIARYEWKAHS